MLIVRSTVLTWSDPVARWADGHLGARQASVPVRRGKLSAAQVAEIGALHYQGLTLTEIGACFDVGQDIARRAVLDAVGMIRRPGRRTETVIDL